MAERGKTTWPCLPELLDPFRGADDIREANTEFLVNDNDFTVSDQRAIDQYIQWLAGQAIEFDFPEPALC